MLNSIRPRAALCLSAGFAGLALAAGLQVRVNYRDQDFTLRDFDSFTATFENGDVDFNGTGNPLGIESRAGGITLTGSSAKGVAARAPDQTYFLKDVTVSGGAHLTLSTEVAQAYAAEQAKAAGRASPAAPAENTLTKLDTEVLHYTGDASSGRAEFPGSVTIDSQSTGRRAAKDKSLVDYSRILHVTGASGFTTLSLNAAGGKNALRTGELKGPVAFSMHNEDHPATGAAEVTTLEGKADSLKFDLTTTPGRLTLTGNVAITGKGPTASGDIAADTVIVSVDANLQPTKVEVTGAPATTRLREEPRK